MSPHDNETLASASKPEDIATATDLSSNVSQLSLNEGVSSLSSTADQPTVAVAEASHTPTDDSRRDSQAAETASDLHPTTAEPSSQASAGAAETEAGATGRATLSQHGYISAGPDGRLPLEHPYARPQFYFLARATYHPTEPTSKESVDACTEFDRDIVPETIMGLGLRTDFPEGMDYGDVDAYPKDAKYMLDCACEEVGSAIALKRSEFLKREGLASDTFSNEFVGEAEYRTRLPHPREEHPDIDWEARTTIEPDMDAYKAEMSKIVGTKELNEKPLLYAMTVFTDGPSYIQTEETQRSIQPPKSKLVTIVQSLPGYSMNEESRVLTEAFAAELRAKVEEAAKNAEINLYPEIEDPAARLQKICAESFTDITNHTKPLMSSLYDQHPKKDLFRFIPADYWVHNE
ncbi:hypothetical protein IAU59_004625 [Kwoniella sp. CBS 9459]